MYKVHYVFVRGIGHGKCHEADLMPCGLFVGDVDVILNPTEREKARRIIGEDGPLGNEGTYHDGKTMVTMVRHDLNYGDWHTPGTYHYPHECKRTGEES